MISFIIEGCDGTGKTTLAKALASRLGMEYMHVGAPRTMEEAKKFYEVMAPKVNAGKFVMDRFMLGEKIYAPIKRGYYPLYMDELEQSMTNSLLILLSCPYEQHQKQFDGQFVKANQLEGIKARYKLEFDLSKYPLRTEFINNSTPKQLLDEVIEYAQGL